MRCETCHGIPQHPPCPDCGGCGITSCCDGAVGTIKDHHLPGLTCPWCGQPADGQSNAIPGERQAPKFGDLMVCAYCAQPCEYTVMGLGRLSNFKHLHPQEQEEIERTMRIVRSAPAPLRMPPVERLFRG